MILRHYAPMNDPWVRVIHALNDAGISFGFSACLSREGGREGTESFNAQYSNDAENSKFSTNQSPSSLALRWKSEHLYSANVLR